MSFTHILSPLARLHSAHWDKQSWYGARLRVSPVDLLWALSFQAQWNKAHSEAWNKDDIKKNPFSVPALFCGPPYWIWKQGRSYQQTDTIVICNIYQRWWSWFCHCSTWEVSSLKTKCSVWINETVTVVIFTTHCVENCLWWCSITPSLIFTMLFKVTLFLKS